MMTTWAAENSTWAVKTITWAAPGHHLGGGFFMEQILINQSFKGSFRLTWASFGKHK